MKVTIQKGIKSILYRLIERDENKEWSLIDLVRIVNDILDEEKKITAKQLCYVINNQMRYKVFKSARSISGIQYVFRRR